MVKFFAVVRPWPTSIVLLMLVVTVFGLVSTWLNPAELDSGLGMLLFVQMLLASSGFATTARRGHFDPVLVHGHDRVGALAAQWLASIAPGALAWIAVSAAAWKLGNPSALSALAGTRLAAFLIVSAGAWTTGFLLPRGSGGALWIGILVVLLLRHAEMLPAAGSDASAVGVARTAGTILLCPFLLLGAPASIGSPAVAAALAVAAAVLLATWRAGARLDVFLVERS